MVTNDFKVLSDFIVDVRSVHNIFVLTFEIAFYTYL